jgi:homoserine O-acetyltransferase
MSNRFTFAFGAAQLACEIAGPTNAPVAAVLGGISASCHVTTTAGGAGRGWWDAIAGPARALDTQRLRVLSIDYALAGPNGMPVTTADQANALLRALDVAGVDRLGAFVGASYGGMVALAFGALHRTRVSNLVVIGAAHEPDPMATALRMVQRRIVSLAGECGRSRDGVALARALAMTTYRTGEEFADRFSASRTVDQRAAQRALEEYLTRSGERFAESCDADRYVALSRSIDLHSVRPEQIRVPATLVAVRSDRVVPARQMRDLARRFGAPCRLLEIHSRYGHDAFLKETTAMSAILSDESSTASARPLSQCDARAALKTVNPVFAP